MCLGLWPYTGQPLPRIGTGRWSRLYIRGTQFRFIPTCGIDPIIFNLYLSISFFLSNCIYKFIMTWEAADLEAGHSDTKVERGILSHRMYSSISLSKSTPPQNRQLIVYHYWSGQWVDDFRGELIFYNYSNNSLCEMELGPVRYRVIRITPRQSRPEFGPDFGQFPVKVVKGLSKVIE